MVDLLYPHKFSTIMEMDYGTPFDRVTIIELSSEHKKRKKVRQPGQESPQSLFTGLIRRLSKREKGSASREVSWLTGAWTGGLIQFSRQYPRSAFQFHDNYAFEMEAPKSPWRYPHLFLAGKSPKFGKSQPRSPTQCPLQPASPRARYLSPVASAQRQAEVQHHAAPCAAPPRPPLRRTESTSTCSSAEDASGLAELQQQQQRHRRRRSLSASEAKKTAAAAADVVAVKVDHAESRDDGMGIVGVLDTGNECKGSECRGGRTNT